MDADWMMDGDEAQQRRDDAEYEKGYNDTKRAQEAGPVGSVARERAYAEMEARWEREGFDG